MYNTENDSRNMDFVRNPKKLQHQNVLAERHLIVTYHN